MRDNNTAAAWLYQTLVELSIPALYHCCKHLVKTSIQYKQLRQTRHVLKQAGRAKDVAGLEQLLLRELEDKNKALPADPVCLFRGWIGEKEGEGEKTSKSASSWTSLLPFLPSFQRDKGSQGNGNNKAAVIHLVTEEICWKYFSVRTSRDAYEVEKLDLATNAFTVADKTGCIHIPRQNSTENIDLSLISKRKDPLELSWGKALWNALFRGRYASHREEKVQALLQGSPVTVLGRLRRDEQGKITLNPDKLATLFITEKRPEDILEELNDKERKSILEIGLTAALVAAISLFLFTTLYKSFWGGKGTSRKGEKEEEKEDKYVLIPCGCCVNQQAYAVNLFTKAEPRCPICNEVVDNILSLD